MTPTDVHKVTGRRFVDPFGQANGHSMVLAAGLQGPQIVDEQRARRSSSKATRCRWCGEEEAQSLLVVTDDGCCEGPMESTFR